ncbi:Rieske 2Fe-2S domain-containing protein [Pseudomonas rhizoryzae]|uniref:Rieske 2Fe-2S domain-containing protein n=1 Tax=Pseudomonas rhizoryzae TaxID=2571129 RepID=UPI0007379CD2|nr:Rieske 2Fe-2S domain-containing protein [Pseudomonas rhizoryzae]KTT30985.1 benzene 1,2-dioxygenase [Pseudomonas psychrotolerans]KTT34018.1 benzene 1,2-dioxygenase [Pseudomonas psychrotolerans]KTT76583.1 benzene 1,2-dioxygenase [Pseudomonas psychrotolerans]
MISMFDRLARQVADAVEDDPARGVFRCRRSVFTDPALFELELKHLFEGGWVYLAHESQIPAINDYFTTWIGRQPVMITRDKQGDLHGLVNACAHRGAMLCRRKQGNKSSFTCPFHGWTFSNGGKLLKVKDGKHGAYPEQFDCDGSHDLTRLARFETYRGFLFGSLSAAVPELSDYLGETRVIIDQIVDQAPEGLEVLRGNSTYTYDGNWKLQMENGADGYHVSSVHWNYSATMQRRNYAAEGTRTVDANGWSKSVGGVYGFEHGHILLWTQLLNPEVRPVYGHREALRERLGAERAELIVGQTRNLCLYPNVYLMDQFSTQIRVVRPLAVDKTEVTIYCFAPKGESAADRALRIRQYEDFFNVSGMGTPDDLEEFRACQSGYQGNTELWNDLSRGALHWQAGADDNARALGMAPLLSGPRTEDEGLFVRQHAYWAQALGQAIERERATLVATDGENAA